MHTKFILTLGSAAWLLMANPAFADGVSTGSQQATGGSQVNVSAGNESETLTDDSSVEYRRNSRNADRTGRNDRSSSDARSGGSSESGSGGGSNGGGDGGGDGGGAVD